MESLAAIDLRSVVLAAARLPLGQQQGGLGQQLDRLRVSGSARLALRGKQAEEGAQIRSVLQRQLGEGTTEEVQIALAELGRVQERGLAGLVVDHAPAEITERWSAGDQ